MNSPFLVLVGFFSGNVHMGNKMPADASNKDNFFSLVIQALIAVPVAELLLLSVTEVTIGIGV